MEHIDGEQLKTVKASLLLALNKIRVGTGLRISNPNDPYTARSLIELVKEHPNDLEILDYGFSCVLMRKVSMARSMSKEMLSEMKSGYQVLDADAIDRLGLMNGHALPVHEFREGVPDDFNGPPDRFAGRNMEAPREAPALSASKTSIIVES